MRIGLVERGLSGVLAALALLDRFDRIEIGLPADWAGAGGGDHAGEREGEVLPVDRLSAAMQRAWGPAIVRRWPGFETRADGRATAIDRAIVFVDPLQAMLELADHPRITIASGADAATIRMPRFGAFASSSLIVEAAGLGSVARPILHEISPGHGVRQYLPLEQGRMMVRERVDTSPGVIDPFFGAERILDTLHSVTRRLEALLLER